MTFYPGGLFSYNEKHNEANGEDNRDGSSENHSTIAAMRADRRPVISALRRQLRKNQLACLLLAQGPAADSGGDEVGNSQNGNNNAYCQDNETGWVGWRAFGRRRRGLTDFIGHMTSCAGAFRRCVRIRWLDGRAHRRILRRVVADAGRRGHEGRRLGNSRKAAFSLTCSVRPSTVDRDLHRADAAPEEIAFKCRSCRNTRSGGNY